jgi:hypothetical protein
MRVELKVLRGWLVTSWRKNGWRLHNSELDDYIQQGLLRYLQVEKHYAHITEPRHLIALFKTTWNNDLHDAARKTVHTVSMTRPDADSGTSVVDVADSEHVDLEDIEWRASKLSPDCRDLLAVFTSPLEAINLGTGIVLTIVGARKLAQRMSWSIARVRNTYASLLEEFSMALTPIQILATATGTQQKEGEARAAFLVRLIESVGELSDAAWEALDADTQAYFNKQAALVNDGKPVEDIPDPKPETKPVSEARAAQRNRQRPTTTAKTDAPATDAKAAEGAKSEEKPEAAAAPTKAAASTVQPSPTQRARTMMMLNEEVTPAVVRDTLKAEGFPTPAMSALQAMRSDTRACIRILREHGKLKE